uniref:Uncharacterized protein n=1 Tax=Anguilla anguilla TaxID=7936 RepID=A0A0E9S1E1_ANGAN
MCVCVCVAYTHCMCFTWIRHSAFYSELNKVTRLFLKVT